MAEFKDETRLERLHRRLHEETMVKMVSETRLERLHRKLNEAQFTKVDKNVVAENVDNVKPEEI